MTKRKRERSLRFRRTAVVAVVVLILAAALLAFTFREDIADLINSASAEGDRGEPWVFEQSSSQVFAAAGRGFASVSTTGIQLIGADGYTVARSVFSLENPAVAACSGYAAAYDIGGKTLRLADFSGEVRSRDTPDAIIAVDVNEAGYMAVVTEAAGYKGMVTVFDPAGEELFKWYSGEGYPLMARVSPDGAQLAALTAAPEGGAVHIYALSSQDRQGYFLAENELFFDLAWLDSSSLCAISEQRMAFLNAKGEQRSEYDFSGKNIVAYSMGGSGFAAVALSDYLAGSADLIVTLGENGSVLGEIIPEGTLKGICASGRELALLFSDSAAVYSRTLARQGGGETAPGVKKLLLNESGECILLYATSAEVKTY